MQLNSNRKRTKLDINKAITTHKTRTFISTMRCHIQSDCPQNSKKQGRGDHKQTNKNTQKNSVHILTISTSTCVYVFFSQPHCTMLKKCPLLYIVDLKYIQALQDTSRVQEMKCHAQRADILQVNFCMQTFL